MSKPTQREQALAQLKTQLDTLADVDASKLARTDELAADINFKTLVPHFQEMLDACKALRGRDLKVLTHESVNQLKNSCTKLSEYVKAVQDFSLRGSPNPATACDEIITRVINGYDEVVGPMLLPLAYTATQSANLSRIEREASGIEAAMKELHAEATKELNRTVDQARSALTAVQDLAAQAGVSQNAQIFIQEAEDHGSTADHWYTVTKVLLGITIVVVCAVVATAFLFVPNSTLQAVQVAIGKILLVSTLSIATGWASRIYRAEKHNQTLNKHRANALLTFRAFVEGTADQRVKDAVLVHAAQAAFAGRATGYENSDPEPTQVNPVVEVLGRTLGDGGTS